VQATTGGAGHFAFDQVRRLFSRVWQILHAKAKALGLGVANPLRFVGNS
jgi:hypothetical protein